MTCQPKIAYHAINVTTLTASLFFPCVCHAQFDTIINSPPTIISDNESIGSNTQLNVFEGGSVGKRFHARRGSQVTITGGTIGDAFNAFDGSQISISGGTFRGFSAFDGSQVTISGGTFGKNFHAYNGSQVAIFGGEFLLNNVPTEQSNVTLGRNDVFTGTLEDGTPFIFSPTASDHFFGGDTLRGVTLAPSTLPPATTSPITVNSQDAPHGLRAGESLILQEGGVLPDHFAVVNATVDITGGVVGEGMEVVGSQVTISGGTVGGSFLAFDGSQITITGGTIEGVYARNGSEITIAGGVLPNYFEAFGGSQVTISGGSVGGSFQAHVGSQITLSGGEFLLNGLTPQQSDVTLSFPGTDVLTGTLEDGTPFILSPLPGPLFFGLGPVPDDRLGHVTLAPATLPPLAMSTMMVNSDNAPRGLRAGESLTLHEGGVLPDQFVAVNAMLDITGGVVGRGLEVAGSQVEVSGGTIDDVFRVFGSSRVTISGGSVGPLLRAFHGSRVSISGGNVGDSFLAIGSQVTISGGTISDSLYAYDGSEVSISGGTVGDFFHAWPGSQVILSGGTVGNEFTAREFSHIRISGVSWRAITVAHDIGGSWPARGGCSGFRGGRRGRRGTRGSSLA